ncbi:MAG: hypothetical protein IJ803_06020 [Oribacterium sp.]|nr:hypothetical protein [Oribacterium sp.]
MRLNEYQVEAGKTIDRYRFNHVMEEHAMHGMATELGRLNGYYLHDKQDLREDRDIYKRNRIGNLFWYLAEYCTANDWSLEDVARESLSRKQYEK